MDRRMTFLCMLMLVILVMPGFAGGTKEATAQVDRDHTLIWAVAATPAGLDINFYWSFEAMEAERNIYDSLARYKIVRDPQSGFLVPDFNSLEGMLAEKWWLSDNGKTLFIKLREGVKSQHGNELTADDVLWRYLSAFDVQGSVVGFGLQGFKVTDPKQIQKVDKYTFSITMPSVNPLAEAWLTHITPHVMDGQEAQKHTTEDDPGAVKWTSSNSAGHGPYKVTEFIPGDRVSFESHEGYWDKSYPLYFKRVIMKEVPASSNRMALLLSGDVDAARDLNWKELKELEGKPGVKVMHWPSNIIQRVEFNCAKAPFDTPLVRKALGFATPYQEIIDSVYLGMVKQAKSINPSTYPTYTGDFWKYELNHDKAREMLKQAGYPNGFKTTLEIESGVPEAEQIAIILKNSFKKVGVEVEIEKLLTGDFYTKVSKHEFKGMYLFRDMPGVVDGLFSVDLWIEHPSHANIGEYRNEEINRLYQEAQTTLDQNVRAKNAHRIQEIAVWEDPAWIFLVEPGYHLAVRDDIDGLAWQTLQEIRWGLATRKK